MKKEGSHVCLSHLFGSLTRTQISIAGSQGQLIAARVRKLAWVNRVYSGLCAKPDLHLVFC
jgi:hypothetical protein